MLCTSDFMDDVIFSRSGPYGNAWLAALRYRGGVYECFVIHYGLMLLSISQQRRKTVADTDNLFGGRTRVASKATKSRRRRRQGASLLV